MDTIILFVVGIVAVGVLLEARKRRGGRNQHNTFASTEEKRTAAEVGPTETGKFRVDHMLKQTKHLQSKNNSPNDNNTDDSDEDTPLPDPFKK